ncbi:hypothetical protein V8E55_004800 [Tylopilus felleus]
MPALTFSDAHPDPDVPASSRDHANPYPRIAPPRHNRIPPDVVYTHAHFDTPPTHDRLYSPSLPHHIPPSSASFSHFALQQPSTWQHHIPLLHHNPYPPPQPPQLVHKAVLLLRPNVSLFSTDALPVNCSAYSTNPDALRPPCRPSSTPSALRTCECLTQTLCCHTCGAAVGYMIVIPCSRCTSSISATNRATNGHRFVFHSSEIVASERHHIPDEPGVLPVEYPTPPPPPSSPPPLAPAYLHSADVATHRRPGSFVPSQAFQPLQTPSPSSGSDYSPSSQLESPDLAPSSGHSSPDLPASVPSSPRRSPRPLHHSPFLHNPIPQTMPEARGAMPEPSPRKLKAGDVLCWHHLTKHGEIPGVEEDPRARIPNRDVLKFLDR